MKLMLEKILPSENSSWRFWCYQDNEIEFNWHYHPEYEIALTLESYGKRYVGDSIEDYDELDLALLGPHLPHTWNSSPELNGQLQRVYVAQIPAEWLENLILSMPELESFKALLTLSKRGLTFSKLSAKKVASHFKNMHKGNASQRFVSLMAILQLMVDDENKKTLSSAGYNITQITDFSCNKLDKIIQYIHHNFTGTIKANDVAKLVHMSTNHFHRFFKQRTEQTFTEVVNQLRISKACSLLINSEMPISTISDLCGFNNISNFNRRFLLLKAMKPSHFRKQFKSIGKVHPSSTKST